MAATDFYKILGVSHTASADEIKLAHRDLVKKYHPDLFPGGTQKARANRKLQEINEAYAILSNAERRQQYDSKYFQRETIVEPAGATGKRSSTTTFRRPPAVPIWETLARRANEKSQQTAKALRDGAKTAWSSYRDFTRKARTAKQTAATQSTSALRKSGSFAARAWHFARPWTRWVSVKMTVGILLTMVLLLALQAAWKEPEVAIAWTLFESTVVEPPRDDSGARKWSPLGHHSSRAECIGNLEQRVRLDEQAGSKVFLDQRTGTIAMTIYVKTEAMLTEEFLQEKLKQHDSGIAPEVLKEQAANEAHEFVKMNGLSQRVNQYQCRETQIVKPDSWLRSKLRRIGIIS